MRVLSLVDDELIAINQGTFRIQVWRGANLTPVVLFCKVAGSRHPKWCAARLAQIAIQQYLGYTFPLPIWFFYGLSNGHTLANKAVFDVVGTPLRPVLRKPTFTVVDPCVIERLFHLEPVSY